MRKPSSSSKKHVLQAKQVLLPTLCACLVGSSMLMATGCVQSNTITQKVYEQNKNNEVDQTAQKLLINSLDAKQTSDQLPQLVTDPNNPAKDKTTENLPQYGGNTSDALVAAPETAAKNDNDVSQDNKDQVSEEKTAAGSAVDGKKKGKKSKKGKGNKKGKKGKNPDAEGDDVSDTGKGKNAKNEVKVYKDYGEFAEVPEEITKVTAVGQAAVIVSMLAGTEEGTPLVGADADFVEDEQIQKVLANKSVDKVAKLWEEDGTEKGDLIGTKELLAADPDLCFVMEGDKTFTDKQEETLLKNNVLVYYIPNMTSASKITYAVQLIGDILEKGGNEHAGEMRDKYLEYHDDLVDKFKKKNDGITGGFNFDSGKKATTEATTMISLFITDWDKDAVYEDKNAGYITSNQGVAIADIGYEDKPVSYYMSVGGALNNAAGSSWRSLSGHSAVVWQFSQSQTTSAWKQWDKIDREKVTYQTPASDGMTWSLCWNEDESAGLGTEEYPGVIVANKEIKDLMEEDSHRANGLYHPFPLTDGSQGGVVKVSMVGYYSGSNLIKASIGTSGKGTKSFLNDGENCEYYDIHVNPQGLVGSWTDGSVESILESSWIQQTFRDDTYNAEDDVKEFYDTFYDYELSDDELEAIMAGPES